MEEIRDKKLRGLWCIDGGEGRSGGSSDKDLLCSQL